jgi:hypothetical protein
MPRSHNCRLSSSASTIRTSAVSDPYVRVSDLLAKTFNAQAVVLSACDTALGKEFAGEGIIGLRYAALARGAHAVVASLWSVPDGVSADLMTDLYRHMGAAHALAPKSPVERCRLARRSHARGAAALTLPGSGVSGPPLPYMSRVTDLSQGQVSLG